MRLHLIETANEIRPLNLADKVFSSGCWHISTDLAQELIGHEVFFHKQQRSPSHFGGRVTGFEILPAGHACEGRIVLHFVLTDRNAGKGVRADRAPWGREKAIVRAEALAA